MAEPSREPTTSRRGGSRQASDTRWLTVRGARHNNLKNIDVEFPLGRFVCVTGVSGSGKSSLVNDILREALARDLNGVEGAAPGAHDAIEGAGALDKIISIDQSPIGRTPRSNPATYIKLFDEIRDLFAQLPDSRVRGYAPGRFSFNVATGAAGGGRCEACEGNGANRVEMDFLADVWVPCPVCGGRRFNHETLQIRYKGRSIHDILEMDVQEALAHFEAHPKISGMLRTLHDVGLDYLKLGQSSTTLSGGEAQRIKLARELVRRSTGRTLYLLDEPTTGLHFEDIRRLLAVLHGFVDAGNSVLVIEHNLDVIKTADWVIDLGPEGGDAGGRVVVSGPPEAVAACRRSYTGAALQEVLGNRGRAPKKRLKSESKTNQPGGKRLRRGASPPPSPFSSPGITVVGAKEHNLKDITVHVPRGAITVCCGVSGSGKTSFAIDTVYTEGQRRYVESLSAYARQFLGQLQKPKVDHVHGLSPAIAIEQKSASRSPRSTVGTVTEIYDYMRVLWARVGQAHCPRCRRPIGTQTSDEIIGQVVAAGKGSRRVLCAPISCGPGEDWPAVLARCRAQGYVRVRIDGEIVDLEREPKIDVRRRHEVEVLVDRVVIGSTGRSRIADSIEHCLSLGNGVMIVVEADRAEGEPPRGAVRRFSQHLACEACGASYEELTPHHFSFNSRLGWCPRCEGLGVQRGTRPDVVLARPDRSLLGGAINGWEEAGRRPLLRAMIVTLAGAIGFDPESPVESMTAEQRHALLFGLGDRWIALDEGDGRGRGPGAEAAGLRFQWKGFFPAIDEATRVSWQCRMKLQDLVTEVPCQACEGGRIASFPAAARLGGRTIVEVCAMPLSGASEFFGGLDLDRRQAKIAGELLHEIRSRLAFLLDVGLGYLTLGRSGPTLSGGESQRIRLASQIGSGLTGVLYVLDEPTIGLHPRDNARLVAALGKLRNLGNTLLMVEHDREVIEASDHLLDFGPGAGASGGHVVAAGSPSEVRRSGESLTGRYLSGREAIAVPINRREVGDAPGGVRYEADEEVVERRAAGRSSRRRAARKHAGRGAAGQPFLTIVGARQNNLKGITVALPLGRFVCVTGVSGSGKSSLITDILHPALASRLHRAALRPGAHDTILGLEHVDKVINVDQAPIGDSPLSSAATYTGVFDLIRGLFARLPESKVRGYTENRFSFNRPGGRCDDCEGQGQVCHEMHFLPDVWVPCETCGGARYQKETLEVRYKGRNIAEVLEMTVAVALEHFANVPKVRRLLQTLSDVGLGYLPLGQSAPTLSGGEAQRVKLAGELARPSTGKTVYLLDEPTTGLHFDDLRRLLDVLHRLVDLGNSVICIEHNLDVIKTADWVVDLGPEAGDDGGRVVAEGTPEAVAAMEGSHTGRLLRPVLEAGPRALREVFSPEAAAAGELGPAGELPAVANEEAAVKMPWQRDGRRWHTQDRASREGKPVEWEGAALVHVIGRIERLGGRALRPTDWADRARVEVCGRAPTGVAQSAVPWFLHALTGGRWLLDLIFRVPRGAFDERRLASRLALKTLDEREDIPAYGQSSRVQVRPSSPDMDQIRVMMHDLKEASTPAFHQFLDDALRRYLSHVTGLAAEPAAGEPWKKDGRSWHLSGRSIPQSQRRLWNPADLLAFIGRVRKVLPELDIDWSGKAFIGLNGRAGRRLAKIVTHQGEALRVDVHVPGGRFTPTQVEGLGFRQALERKGSSGAGLSFWFRRMDEVDTGRLGEVLEASSSEAPHAAGD